MAIRLAQGNLGGIARNSPRALEYLMQTVDPNPWLAASWTFGDSRSNTASLMVEGSLFAIACVDQPRAYAFIDSLESAGVRGFPSPDKFALHEARRISSLVREKGTLKVWEDLDKEPKH